MWFIQEPASGTPISGPILTQKELQFYRQLNDDAPPDESSGWLDRFKWRHGIRQLRIQGERLSADTDNIRPFIVKLFNLIQQNDLHHDQLYNADETGLYWRLLSDKTW